MPKVTFEVTPGQRKLMDLHPEINWSEVLRQAVERQARIAKLAKEMQEELDDPRIKDMAAAVKRGMGRRWRDEHRG